MKSWKQVNLAYKTHHKQMKGLNHTFVAIFKLYNALSVITPEMS